MRGNALGGAMVPSITTNEVTLQLQRMPAEMEAAKLQEIRAELAALETRTA
jgi:hypothetical protein